MHRFLAATGVCFKTFASREARIQVALSRGGRAMQLAQQPGKPKPPGNPPESPDPEKPPPVEEPPEPMPIPTRDDPPPMQV
jgi:hypothetical protein